MQFHGYSLAEIEGMIPFEREVYLALLTVHLKEKKNKQQAAQVAAKYQ